MEATVIQAGTDPVIYPKHLPAHIRLEFLKTEKQRVTWQTQENKGAEATPLLEEHTSYALYKRGWDKSYFQMLINSTDYDINKISEISRLSVPSVYRYLAQVGIPTKKKQRRERLPQKGTGGPIS